MTGCCDAWYGNCQAILSINEWFQLSFRLFVKFIYYKLLTILYVEHVYWLFLFWDSIVMTNYK